MIITEFTSLVNPKGWQREIDLEPFFSEPRPLMDKRSLPLFSFATFRNNERSNGNLIEISVLGFDLDVEELTASDIRGALNALGCGGIFHTSRSHHEKSEINPTAMSRWRLFIPTEKPMNVTEYSYMHRRVRDMFPFKVGTEASDASRAWYVPALGTYQNV